MVIHGIVDRRGKPHSPHYIWKFVYVRFEI